MYVFAYGSLIWRPDFPFLAAARAHLHGFHRRMCIYSWVHRGTHQHPGLVLGMVPGGSCTGLVYRVAADVRDRVEAELMARECSTDAYLPIRPLLFTPWGVQPALTFRANPHSPQLAPRLGTAQMARIVRAAHGRSGPNIDYVTQSHAGLLQWGIRDRALAALVRALHPLAAAPGPD